MLRADEGSGFVLDESIQGLVEIEEEPPMEDLAPPTNEFQITRELKTALNKKIKVLELSSLSGEENKYQDVDAITFVKFDPNDGFLAKNDLYKKVSFLYFINKDWYYANAGNTKLSKLCNKFIILEFLTSPFNKIEGLSEKDETSIDQLSELFSNNYLMVPFSRISIQDNNKIDFKLFGINIPPIRNKNALGTLDVVSKHCQVHSITMYQQSIPVSDMFKTRMSSLPNMNTLNNNSNRSNTSTNNAAKLGYMRTLVKEMHDLESQLYLKMSEVFV